MIQRIRYVTRRARSPITAGIIGLACILQGGTNASAQLTEIISIHTNGQQGNDISGRFSGPVVNGNAQIVAFDSQATTLVPNDTNFRVDVFVRDRIAGTTERVSVNSSGFEANGTSTRPAIDDAGNVIAFDSDASNLISGDTNNRMDVFVHNRTTNVTERASVSSTEVQGNDASHSPTISADGRFVCFVAIPPLVADDTNNAEDIYVRDLLNGTTERVSLGDQGQEGNSSTTLGSISANGRWVVFSSFADNFVPDDTNGLFDTFIRDRQTGLTERVSLNSEEQQADANCNNATVTDDGRFVAFTSSATNLVPNDTNGRSDIFVRDRMTGTTERVSVSSNGEQANGDSPHGGVRGFIASNPQITPDGRFVAFFSAASNLVPGDTNTCEPVFQNPPGICPDAFVRDRVLGTTTRVSISSNGTQANDRSADPDITPSGNSVVFFSAAGNLVANDFNQCQPIFPVSCPDIFIHDSQPTAAVQNGGQEGAPPASLVLTTTPNPGYTAVELGVAGADAETVSLVIYDVLGRTVRTLVEGKLAGSTVTWDGTDDQGHRVQPGMYFSRLTNGGRVAVEKIALLHR